MFLLQICPVRNENMDAAAVLALADRNFEIGYFDECTVEFLNKLSLVILKEPTLRGLPAFVALAYWLRKSNIETLKQDGREKLNDHQTIIHQPLGVVFHVCPSNVDTIFVYSLAISLLAGNKNILRVSNRMESIAITRLFNLINTLLDEPGLEVLKKYITVVSYGHDEEINKYYSEHADARIIWGGNKTVQLFKNLPTSPRCRDIAFPDRLSCSIVKATSLLESSEADLKETCRLLYNDAFVFDQLGCSSPQIIFFLGEEADCKKAADKLYGGILHWAKEKYHADPAALASLKLNKLADDAIQTVITDSRRDSNLVVFATLDNSTHTNQLHSCGGGYFYIKHIENLELLSSFFDKRVQTAGYFGLDKTDLMVLSNVSAGKGLDRIVPIGQALAFNNYWDGFHLLNQLTHLQFLEN